MFIQKCSGIFCRTRGSEGNFFNHVRSIPQSLVVFIFCWKSLNVRSNDDVLNRYRGLHLLLISVNSRSFEVALIDC